MAGADALSKKLRPLSVAKPDYKLRHCNVALAYKVFKGYPFHFLALRHATMCNLEFVTSAILSILLK